MNKLSIIVPVYNKKRFVERCIQSILKWGDDCEVIVVDDGSADGSEAIIDKFKGQPNFKLVHKEHGGVLR